MAGRLLQSVERQTQPRQLLLLLAQALGSALVLSQVSLRLLDLLANAGLLAFRALNTPLFGFDLFLQFLPPFRSFSLLLLLLDAQLLRFAQPLSFALLGQGFLLLQFLQPELLLLLPPDLNLFG